MLSNRLKYLRKLYKLSQKDLGEKINTTKGTISNYENQHSTPSNDVLKDLASALNTTTDYLLGRTDNPNPPDEELDEINKILYKYSIRDSGFFDIEKWKAMTPDEIKQLKEYFEFITNKTEN